MCKGTNHRWWIVFASKTTGRYKLPQQWKKCDIERPRGTMVRKSLSRWNEKKRNKNAEIVYIAFGTTINLIIVIFCHSLGILGCRGKKQKEVGLLLFRLGFSKTFYLYKAQGWVGSQLCLIDFKSSIQSNDLFMHSVYYVQSRHVIFEWHLEWIIHVIDVISIAEGTSF